VAGSATRRSYAGLFDCVRVSPSEVRLSEEDLVGGLAWNEVLRFASVAHEWMIARCSAAREGPRCPPDPRHRSPPAPPPVNDRDCRLYHGIGDSHALAGAPSEQDRPGRTNADTFFATDIPAQ